MSQTMSEQERDQIEELIDEIYRISELEDQRIQKALNKTDLLGRDQRIH